VHNALPRGTLSAALARALGDTVGEDGLERYGETLTPVLDLWRRPEWEYLRGELLAGFARSSGAVAGELSAIALVNPTGSGRVYVVETITAYLAVQLNISVVIALEGVIAATLGVVAATSSLDTRWRDPVTGADRTTGIVYSGSDAVGIAGQVERFTPPAGANQSGRARTTLPAILQPGWGIACVGQTANNAIEISVRYRERVALPGELV